MEATLDPQSPTPPPTVELVPLDVEPVDILQLWPRNCPLTVLWSGGKGGIHTEAGRPGNRWVYFASPARRVTFGPQAGKEELLGFFAAAAEGAGRASRQADRRPSSNTPPFASGWLGWVSYEAGAVLEPASGPREPGVAGSSAAASRPLMEWFRIEGVLAYDTLLKRWWRTNADRWHLPDPIASQAMPYRAEAAETQDAAGYQSHVERTVEYIRAGDIYQANITREIRWPFSGSARGFFRDFMREASPWFGAYFEADDPWARRIVASASPELFLSFDPTTREVRTRPMKGTQRIGGEDRLLESSKDAAELTMIVDLMRNDLGRICAPGSVRVENHREIERHGTEGSDTGVVQTTTTVRGTLAHGRTLADILAATFPAGSITGAPKIRAMQIIQELEGRSRGVYCGAIGSIDDSGSLHLSVAIRTASIIGTADDTTMDGVTGTLSYGVGAGIVAESDPESEWKETELKAGGIRRVLRPHDADR